MFSRRSTRYSWSIGACCLALLTGCASAGSPDTVRGALIIVGSGTQQGAINAWSREWSSLNKGTSVSYSPDGPEVGLQALLSGDTYVATTDAPLSEADAAASTAQCGPKGAFSLPTSVTPIGVAYNLGATRGLKLDTPILAAIFSGTIQEWDDPAIAALNPSLDLPQDDIVPVTTKESTALTMAATAHLAADGGGEWTQGASRTWPGSPPGTAVEKEGDIAQEVDDHFGTIAFMPIGDIGTRFNTVAVKFADGFAQPTTEAINEAIAASGVAISPNGVSVNTESATGGYPLAMVNYQVFCSGYGNEVIATLVKSWAQYTVSEPGQTKGRILAGIYSPSDDALRASRGLAGTIEPLR
ncbi:Phosphate-binding protein PstS [Arthrobacter sp. 9AX]|uniref:substrate-binding domain-containing protein n=1 Tax=Arthrobacter sp. 9AX TaxID=2653131 RepID=UPI0012EFF17B|nr:substrate-binding domain-containing protein [Arthrobacter sp. 9AX]VXB55568.1 Phosphate-binding protein PstS [Arthrobacter sp. 9AX]